MQIQLLNVQYPKLEYNVSTIDPQVTNQLNLSFDYITIVREGENNQFFDIVFNLHLTDKNQLFSLKITAMANFQTDEVIDASFKNSDFVNVNAPAIAFPFLRTFVANFMLNTGYTPVIFPSYNFQTLAENKKQPKKVD